MGYWDGLPFSGHEGDGLFYDGGTYCDAIGGYRSSQVTFYSGAETDLIFANETSTCFYEFEITCNSTDIAARKSRRMDFLPLIPNSTVV